MVSILEEVNIVHVLGLARGQWFFFFAIRILGLCMSFVRLLISYYKIRSCVQVFYKIINKCW